VETLEYCQIGLNDNALQEAFFKKINAFTLAFHSPIESDITWNGKYYSSHCISANV